MPLHGCYTAWKSWIRQFIISMETLLHKFYAASISIDTDGSMMVASTDDRILAWALLLFFTAASSLIIWFIWRKQLAGRLAIGCFVMTLVLTALIIPSIRHEYIHVSPSALTIESGNWYRPSITVVEMTNIWNIRESDPQGILPANLIGDPNIEWYVTRTDGNREILELNDFFSAHRMVVAYYYKDRGFWLERMEDRLRIE